MCPSQRSTVQSHPFQCFACIYIGISAVFRCSSGIAGDATTTHDALLSGAERTLFLLDRIFENTIYKYPAHQVSPDFRTSVTGPATAFGDAQQSVLDLSPKRASTSLCSARRTATFATREHNPTNHPTTTHQGLKKCIVSFATCHVLACG